MFITLLFVCGDGNDNFMLSFFVCLLEAKKKKSSPRLSNENEDNFKQFHIK